MAEKFDIGEHQIWVKRHPRRKRLALRVKSGRVELLAPPNLSDRRLFKFAENHQAWWLEALQRLPEVPETVPLAVSNGADWPLLDGTVTLQFRSGSTEYDWADGQLTCFLTKPECDQQRRRVLQAWWLQHAKQHLSQRTDYFSNQIGLFPTEIQIKSYRARWGSCDRYRRIQYNWKLMTLPGWVVDYVVVHELCHLAHMNHSRAFWDLVNQHYPLTSEAKKWLKLHGFQRIQQLS